MYCVVSSCNSLLQEVREWCAGAGVKKELCNFTAIKSMSLYLWMGEWKSQTWECTGRIALGKKSPHLLPSPFTLLGAASGWVIAITPGIACWQPSQCVQGLSGAARHSQQLDSLSLLNNTAFPWGLPGRPDLLVQGNPHCLHPGMEQPQNSPLLQLWWGWPAAAAEEKGSAGLVASN